MDPLTLDEASDDNKETWLERVLLFSAMGGILLLCVIVTLTVISRTIYKPIIPDDVLIVREIMVAAILLPLAAVTAHRSHIAVTVFTEGLSAYFKSALNALGHLIGILFVSQLFYAGLRLFVGAWVSGEYFDGDIYIPMWIGYATFVCALGAFLARLIVMFVVDVRSCRQHTKLT